MTDKNRRTFLRSVGAASVGVLAAGCSGDGGEDTEEATDEPTETPTDSPTEAMTDSPTPTATATATESGTPTETATVTPGEADYTDGPESTALHDPRDGFAPIGHWLEDEWQDVEVRVVGEDDLNERDFIQKVIGTGPRVIVFEASGTIHLENRPLTIGNGKCWIAGQTAPSPGITITGDRLAIEGDDCVIQHIRVKAGDGSPSNPSSLDSIFTQDETENNVIDHCTATWSTDESLSIGYDTNNTTVTNCLIAEPLHDSLHPKGPHGYGSLTGNNAKNVFYAGNVWTRCVDRNPRLKIGTETVIVNNLIHYYADGMWADPETAHSIVGNVFEKPQTNQAHIFGRNEGGGQVYGEDNQAEGDNPMYNDLIDQVDSRPLWPDDLEAAPASEVKEANLTHVGARPADRTEHDQQIIQNIRDGNIDSWVDSQEEVGGYPELEVNTHELDVPADIRGEMRAWLREHARQVEPDQ